MVQQVEIQVVQPVIHRGRALPLHRVLHHHHNHQDVSLIANVSYPIRSVTDIAKETDRALLSVPLQHRIAERWIAVPHIVERMAAEGVAQQVLLRPADPLPADPVLFQIPADRRPVHRVLFQTPADPPPAHQALFHIPAPRVPHLTEGIAVSIIFVPTVQEEIHWTNVWPAADWMIVPAPHLPLIPRRLPLRLPHPPVDLHNPLASPRNHLHSHSSLLHLLLPQRKQLPPYHLYSVHILRIHPMAVPPVCIQHCMHRYAGTEQSINPSNSVMMEMC